MEGRASEVVAQPSWLWGPMGILPIDCYVRTTLTGGHVAIPFSVRTPSPSAVAQGGARINSAARKHDETVHSTNRAGRDRICRMGSCGESKCSARRVDYSGWWRLSQSVGEIQNPTT